MTAKKRTTPKAEPEQRKASGRKTIISLHNINPVGMKHTINLELKGTLLPLFVPDEVRMRLVNPFIRDPFGGSTAIGRERIVTKMMPLKDLDDKDFYRLADDMWKRLHYAADKKIRDRFET